MPKALAGKGAKKNSDFGGGDGLSNRFFERFPTFEDLILIGQGL